MNPARSVRLDKEAIASTRWKEPGKDPRGITKRDSRSDGYEWGVRVCGDAVLLDFWCRYAEILFEVGILRFYKTKRFPELRNFRVIFMRFAVFSCYPVGCLYRISVRFCGIRIPLTPRFVRTDDHVECKIHEREEKLLTNPILNVQLECTVQCWCNHPFVKWLPI